MKLLTKYSKKEILIVLLLTVGMIASTIYPEYSFNSVTLWITASISTGLGCSIIGVLLKQIWSYELSSKVLIIWIFVYALTMTPDREEAVLAGVSVSLQLLAIKLIASIGYAIITLFLLSKTKIELKELLNRNSDNTDVV